MADADLNNQSKGPGRPPVPERDRLNRVLQLRLRDWQDFYAGQLAERWGVGKGEAIRRLLDEELRREAGDHAPALIEFFGRQAVEIDRRRDAEQRQRDPEAWVERTQE